MRKDVHKPQGKKNGSVHDEAVSGQDDAEQVCREKLSFDTLKQARTAATVAQHQRGIVLKPYSCGVCGLWHLTSSHG